MGRLRIDGKQTKQNTKTVIRVDKKNEQRYQAVIPEFTEGGSRYELEDKDQLLWAPHKGLRTATVNKFLRDWKLKRDGMDADDLDFRPNKIEDSKTEESENVENGKQKKSKRKSNKMKEVEIEDTAEEQDPLISRFLKNREDELALFALLSSDRKTAEALKFSSKRMDERKKEFETITTTVEERERKRSVRRQSRQEKMEMETPDRQKRQEERDRARERDEMEEDEESDKEGEEQEQEEEQEMKIREKALNKRQKAIEKNEKMFEKHRAQKPLVKVNANKFMERIIVTEEIENVRPELPISFNASEHDISDRHIAIEVREKWVADKEAEVAAKALSMKIREKELNQRQQAIEEREKTVDKRKARKPLNKVTANKFMERIIISEEIENVRPERAISSNAIKSALEGNIFDGIKKIEQDAALVLEDLLVTVVRQTEEKEFLEQVEQKTKLKESADKEILDRQLALEKREQALFARESQHSAFDSSSLVRQSPHENGQDRPRDDSACENNETLQEGLTPRTTKRKDSRDDTDSISPKRQRKSSKSGESLDENNNQKDERRSLLDILLEDDVSEDEDHIITEVTEESFSEGKIEKNTPAVHGCKSNTKSIVRRARPSHPSRGSILDERLGEKLCAPEELLKMEKITKDNLHEHLHLKAESSEEKLENLKFLARYGIIYNKHQCECKAASTLNRSGKRSKKSDGYHWKCSPCERRSKQGVKVSVRYKCMFESWKQPIASILMAAAKLIDNPLNIEDIAKSLSKKMTAEAMVHWELNILDVIQVVVLNGATREQIGGPDKIVDMERAYLHAEKFTHQSKQKRKHEECFIFMERDSTLYSIVRVAAFGQNTLDEVIARTVREGTKIASNEFDWAGGGATEEAQQQSFVQLHPDRDIRFYKCAAREVSWNGGKNWKAVEDMYRQASALMTNRGDLTLLYVLNRMFPKPFNAFLLGLSKYDTSDPLL